MTTLTANEQEMGSEWHMWCQKQSWKTIPNRWLLVCAVLSFRLLWLLHHCWHFSFFYIVLHFYGNWATLRQCWELNIFFCLYLWRACVCSFVQQWRDHTIRMIKKLKQSSQKKEHSKHFIHAKSMAYPMVHRGHLTRTEASLNFDIQLWLNRKIAPRTVTASMARDALILIDTFGNSSWIFLV